MSANLSDKRAAAYGLILIILRFVFAGLEIISNFVRLSCCHTIRGYD